MSVYTAAFAFSLLVCFQNVLLAKSQVLVQPEQIHLAYGAHSSQMTINWVTQNITISVVDYGTSFLDQAAQGLGPTMFEDGGPQHRVMWMHKVTLTNLQPGLQYMYHVGSDQGWSNIYFFKTMKSGSYWSPRFAVYGDMGYKNSSSLGSLRAEAQKGKIDAVLHVGDFAYDMDTDNAKVGDAFMNQIQSIAAYVPYMVCVGNHEKAYNFSNYKNRFSMPGGDGSNLFYSFDIGPAHIISLSTEVYYENSYEEYGGWLPMINQFRWLEKDLTEANKPENRAKHPWIIVMGHRPMYCSSRDMPDEHCNNLYDNTVRVGIPSMKILGLEDLFYEHGVDLQFYGHVHSYERMWPIYNLTVCNGTKLPYVNPRAPVHIVSGSAGNSEGQSPFEKIPHPWSAFRTKDFGYTRMTVCNSTHIHLEQVSINKGGKVIDKITLIKEKHGAGLYDCHQLH